MARVVIAGAGVCGMTAALMLADDGHEVTVLERDEALQPLDPAEAWMEWKRTGVGQFRMGHIMLARGNQILLEHAPEVVAELLALGGLEFSIQPPATMEEWTPREDDQRLSTVTARRPIIEQAFANVVDRVDNITVRRGVPLAGLHADGTRLDGVPHVAGVVTEAGETITADVVVDATGRRSPMLRWLDALGGPAPAEQSVDSGFAYYGHYLQSGDGSIPEFMAPGLAAYHGYSILTLPGDNGSWFVGVYASSKDAELRVLRDRDTLHRLIAASPLHAHLLDGEELSEVISMVGVADRDRSFVVDGQPVVTGMLPLADAWACTNPSLGRGMSIGIDHAQHLKFALRDGPTDPVEQALAWHETTERELGPLHEATRALDNARASELYAQVKGEEIVIDPDDIAAQMLKALNIGVAYDQDVFRIFAEILHLLDLPANIFARPGVFEHVIAASQGREVIELPGPTRAEFLASLG